MTYWRGVGILEKSSFTQPVWTTVTLVSPAYAVTSPSAAAAERLLNDAERQFYMFFRADCSVLLEQLDLFPPPAVPGARAAFSPAAPTAQLLLGKRLPPVQLLRQSVMVNWLQVQVLCMCQF